MNDRLGDKARLQHILDAIAEIEKYLSGLDRETFAQDSMAMSATLYQLGIIGEASNRLSNELLAQNTDVPWAKIVGLRNMIIHEYFGVDDLTIWNVVQKSLPDLKNKAERILQNLPAI
jgi:uncharacterized protein with HEPN domain